MRLALVFALLFAVASPSGTLAAKPPAKKARTAPSPTVAPPAPTVEDLSKVDLTELLERCGKHYRDLDYDKVLPLAEAVLARPETTIEQRLDAYLMQGSSLAIIGDAAEAEKPFRFLLRGRPDYDMPASTPPKILSIFRKVQIEEKAIVDQMRELERNRILKDLKLTGEPPPKGQGGLPLKFEYRLRDPRGVISQMQLRYRRSGEPGFASTPLARDETGAWSVSIPGEWTQSKDPYRLEYFVTSTDTEGRAMLDLAAATAPLTVPVDAGTVPNRTPLFKNGWFWGGVAVVAVALGTGTYFVVQQGRALPKTDLGTIQAK